MNILTDQINRSRTKHYVGLIRVSTRKQADDNLSLDVQERRIRDHVKDNQFATLNLHVEIGSASGPPARRSVLINAIQEARDTRGILLVVRIDRLSRNLDVLPFLKGINLYSLDEGRVGQKRLKELLTEAEREARAISEGSRASAAMRRAKGQKLGNNTNLDVAQRNGCAQNMARAISKAQDLAEVLQSNPDLIDLSHADLSVRLNGMGFLNRHSAADWVPWTKGSIRSPRKRAMHFLAGCQTSRS